MDSEKEYISDKYLDQDDLKDLEAGRTLEFFKNIADNEDEISNEYRVLGAITMTREHEKALIPHEQDVTAHLNRYSDILPYKHSAVKLSKLYDDPVTGYINANYISGPFGEQNAFIASQGPTKSTVEDMWRMIKEQRIGTIFMLGRLQEGGRSKGSQYWPQEGKEVEFKEAALSIKGEAETTLSTNLYQRDIEIGLDDSDTWTVKQIQYTGWPDHGVPEAEAFDDFETLMQLTAEEYKKNQENGNKMIFHCSAGIGRTGTLLTLNHMTNQIQKKIDNEEEIDKLSVFSTLRKLREERFYLVQTNSQYLFIYQYLANFLLRKGLI